TRRLDDAPVAVEMRIAREQRDFHGRHTSSGSRVLGQSLARLKADPGEPFAQTRRLVPGEEGPSRLDQGAALERRSPEQHAEAHLVANGEGKLDRPGPVAEHELRLDDVPALDLAALIPHGALVDRACLALDL